MRQVNKFAYMEVERGALSARMRGSSGYPNIEGLVTIYWLPSSSYLQAEFNGLPPSRVFGFHIHDGIVCGAADAAEPFPQAGKHYSSCPEGMWCARHPYHAGDLPPIISDENGFAAMQFHLGAANVAELSGKTIILHAQPDDFKTQPSGNSGLKIACGVLAETI